MPEPQSTSFFLLLIVVFGGLMWWIAVAKQLVFRILAACLAFIPAMMFGVAAVNKYYDYYQNWNSAISDLTGQSAQTANVPTTDAGAGVKFGTYLGSTVDPAVARTNGYTLKLAAPGRLSHITRTVYVYLPPQYFQRSYRDYRFPAIELLHGFPGTPLDWITVVGVTTTLQDLISTGLAKPAVLVMPDANGGRGISLQCLDQFHGPQDATYLAEDLPAYIARTLRVQAPGPAWGIAGYSEGGFCAANLGLKYGTRFGFSGVLSGYFAPLPNQLGHPVKLVNPFGGNAKLRRANTPDDLASSLPAGTKIAQFWLGVGSGDHQDLKAAQFFQQLLEIRQPGVPLRIVPGGGHTMVTWRALIPPMLEWMTPQLANEVTALQTRHARAAQRAAAAKQKKAVPAPTHRA
ncbi:MAG TPA: alpha/beta hydrolase-fold protein [Streptosporangiaceae bacterium]|nr:alpha/beta hydrolase-fold protein [Streptosporangiaceae bacterium]